MTAARSSLVLIPLLLAGCGSSAPSVSTASLLGPEGASQAQPVAAAPVTPEQRAAQVGATSARATKCGYNFDPAKLKTSYLIAEMQAGAPPDQLVKAEKAYDTIRNSVASAVAGDQGYCNDSKTREIKADLTRHLAGDFSPPARKVAKDDGGFLGGILDSGTSDRKGPMTADDMWDKTGEQKRRR